MAPNRINALLERHNRPRPLWQLPMREAFGTDIRPHEDPVSRRLPLRDGLQNAQPQPQRQRHRRTSNSCHCRCSNGEVDPRGALDDELQPHRRWRGRYWVSTQQHAPLESALAKRLCNRTGILQSKLKHTNMYRYTHIATHKALHTHTCLSINVYSTAKILFENCVPVRVFCA